MDKFILLYSSITHKSFKYFAFSCLCFPGKKRQVHTFPKNKATVLICNMLLCMRGEEKGSVRSVKNPGDLGVAGRAGIAFQSVV